MIGQSLNCDEKGKLADEESEETFEEAFEARVDKKQVCAQEGVGKN